MPRRHLIPLQRLLLFVAALLCATVAALSFGAFLTDEWIKAWDLSIAAVPYPDAQLRSASVNATAFGTVSMTIGSRRYCVAGRCTTKGPAGFEAESNCHRGATDIDSRYTTAYVFTFLGFVLATGTTLVLIFRMAALDPADFALPLKPTAAAASGEVIPTEPTNDSPPGPREAFVGDDAAMMSSAEHIPHSAVMQHSTRSPVVTTIEPVTVTRERRTAALAAAKRAALVGALVRVAPVGVATFFLELIAVAIIAGLHNSYLTCGGASTCSRLTTASPGAWCGWGPTFRMNIASTVLSLVVLALGAAWGVVAQRSIEAELSEEADDEDDDDGASPPRELFEPTGPTTAVSNDVAFSSSAIRNNAQYSGSGSVIAASPSEQFAMDAPSSRPPVAE